MPQAAFVSWGQSLVGSRSLFMSNVHGSGPFELFMSRGDTPEPC